MHNQMWISTFIINKSYCLINQGWGKNQLHKEENTTEEETVQLISLSPSWLQQLPNKTETKEDDQSNVCWIKAEVRHIKRQSITILRDSPPFIVPVRDGFLLRTSASPRVDLYPCPAACGDFLDYVKPTNLITDLCDSLTTLQPFW